MGTEQLEAILQTLEQADTLDALQSVTLQLRDYYEVGHVTYHWVDAAGDQYGCGTYPEEWRERYIEQNYLRIDPVIQGCYQRFHPVDWKRLNWSSKAARLFQRESLEYGLGDQGFSVPIRGPNGQFALFTINHNTSDEEWAQYTNENQQQLILIAHYFNRQALTFEASRKPAAPSSLSPREVDAMTLLAIGHSRAEVAQALSISEHTLRVYIESARFKLGATNTIHAVARAISQGLIVV